MEGGDNIDFTMTLTNEPDSNEHSNQDFVLKSHMKIIKRIGMMILGYTTIICLVGIIHMATIHCIVRSGEHTNTNSMCAVDRRFPLANRAFWRAY